MRRTKMGGFFEKNAVKKAKRSAVEGSLCCKPSIYGNRNFSGKNCAGIRNKKLFLERGLLYWTKKHMHADVFVRLDGAEQYHWQIKRTLFAKSQVKLRKNG